jgi:hypothetical protein
MEGPAAVPMISTMFGLLFHHAPVRNRRVGEYNSNFTKSLGFMVDIELVTKVYKPTYNCGHHLAGLWPFFGFERCVFMPGFFGSTRMFRLNRSATHPVQPLQWRCYTVFF